MATYSPTLFWWIIDHIDITDLNSDMECKGLYKHSITYFSFQFPCHDHSLILALLHISQPYINVHALYACITRVGPFGSCSTIFLKRYKNFIVHTSVIFHKDVTWKGVIFFKTLIVLRMCHMSITNLVQISNY